ncbi:hypothetical protein SEA_CRATER_84 [Gordonia phage Crater]|nr:hypothetical protein SEA_CRATER_84 [Gordonia phage Crater]
MTVPSLESLIAQHLPLHGEYRAGNVGCTCGWEAFVKVDPIAHDLDEFKTETFAKHVADVIRQQWLTAEYIAAGTEGPDMDWTSEETWATPTDAEEWHRRTQNQGWVERRFVSEWVRVADGAEDHQ